MSTILVGNCAKENLYQLWDADAASETEFEYIVAKTLICVYPQYHCIVFGGGFKLEGETHRPDLALIAKDFSHWFVIEVELISHSLLGHVLPQMRTFRYGEPQPDCASILARETKLPHSQISTFLKVVPRSVAVVLNKKSKEWETSLGSLEVQLLTVSAYKSSAGIEAVEVDGQLAVLKEHLGFGIFSATDRSLRFPASVRLPEGEVVINDGGTGALWTVVRDAKFAWVTKNIGVPDILNGSHVQLIRTYSGEITIRKSMPDELRQST